MASIPDQYAVLGNPIAHSQSPFIHQCFAQATQQTMAYQALCVPLDGFAAYVQQFFAEGGKGCNVTVPFKQEAWALAQVRSEQAERAGAVNTLLLDASGRYYGHNTDGLGLLRDLQVNQGIDLANKRVLLLGAGGAVRGVLQPLLAAQTAEVIIANRTLHKAEQLAALFADAGAVSACEFNDLQGKFDVIVNGTAASLQDELPPLPDGCLQAGAAAYDMMYAPQATAFMCWAQQQGAAKTLDGLGMLVEQAAAAFECWRGVKPETAPVLQALRATMR